MGEVLDEFGLAGTTLGNKYEVRSVAARGGFGLVYRAFHSALQKNIALKVLVVPPDLNDAARDEFMRLFLREAPTIARLRHPAVVQVLDSGVDTMPTGVDAPWMAMDWIDGEPLDDQLAARRGEGGRSPAATFKILRPVLEALAYAHELGIAHRDIKPSNMMLQSHFAGSARHGIPEIQLLDFGIAKIMEIDEDVGGGQTRTRSVGTAFSPHYAAPEQVGGSRTGPWTDVHAMGLILTEVLTDQPAYTPGDQTEMAIQVLSPVRPTPGSRGVSVGGWEPVIAKALALLPRERYASVGELLTALDEALPSATAARQAARMSEAPAAMAVAPVPGDDASTAEGIPEKPTGDVHTTLRALASGPRGNATPNGFRQGLGFALGVGAAGVILGVVLYGVVSATGTLARPHVARQSMVVQAPPAALAMQIPLNMNPAPAPVAVAPTVVSVPAVIAPVTKPPRVAVPRATAHVSPDHTTQHATVPSAVARHPAVVPSGTSATQRARTFPPRVSPGTAPVRRPARTGLRLDEI